VGGALKTNCFYRVRLAPEAAANSLDFQPLICLTPRAEKRRALKTNLRWDSLRIMAALTLCAVILPATGYSQANSWTSTSAGQWETAGNWSAGAPTNSHSVFITNAPSKTVTIGSTTTNFPTTLTISNLTVSAPVGSANTLLLDRVGLASPLRILRSMSISNNATLLVFSNSVVQVGGVTGTDRVTIDGGGFVNLLSGGSLITTNADINVGFATTGVLSLSDGTLIGRSVVVANSPGSQGTLTIGGGASRFNDLFIVGQNLGAAGAVWLTGGLLVTTNNNAVVGSSGVGQMAVSNGTWLARVITVASQTAGRGTLTFAGGTNLVTGEGLRLGGFNAQTGTVFVSGGQLFVTNAANTGSIDIRTGTFTISGGTVFADRLVITNIGGAVSFPRGTMTLRGSEISNNLAFLMAANGTAVLNLPAGTNRFQLGFQIGLAGNATGLVWITGGHLLVTNQLTTIGDTHFGQITLSNGSWRARDVNVGRNFSSRGVLTVAGGTNSLTSQLRLGSAANSTGVVWLTGGELVVTNDSTFVGHLGAGEMTVSNGIFRARDMRVGNMAGSGGTLRLAGGTNLFSLSLSVSFGAGGTGTVWMTGGELVTTNASLGIGINGLGHMTISNGTCRTLNLSIGDSLGRVGTLTIAGGTTDVAGVSHLGINANSTGTVWMTGGHLSATNDSTIIGASGIGSFTMSNGLARLGEVFLGLSTGGRGSLTVAGGDMTINRLVATNSGSMVAFPAGTTTVRGAAVATGQGFMEIGGPGQSAVLNVAAGTNRFDDTFIVAFETNATGLVVVNGGQLVTTNQFNTIAVLGNGTVILSNGSWRARTLLVGEGAGSAGRVHVAGGVCALANLSLGDDNPTATGTVSVTGGELLVTNGTTSIAQFGVGNMTVSNGTWRAMEAFVAEFDGAAGTLAIAGGTNSVTSNLILGTSACTATGIVNVTGGNLFVTNAAGTATLDVRSGTFTQTGGTLEIDRLVVTNACARFIHTGGTLVLDTVVLATNALADADGDGIDTKWEQDNGYDPLDPSDAALDEDGDGKTTLDEFTMGTDPNDANSFLRITSIVVTNSTDVLITWAIAPTSGNGLFLEYIVQSGTNLLTGVTNNLSPPIFVGPGAGSTTNYLDVGGATNVPPRFYRIRGRID